MDLGRAPGRFLCGEVQTDGGQPDQDRGGNVTRRAGSVGLVAVSHAPEREQEGGHHQIEELDPEGRGQGHSYGPSGPVHRATVNRP